MDEVVRPSIHLRIPGPGVRVPVFDGLRGLAILSVLIFHTVGLWGSPTVVDRAVLVVRSAGWLGVDLFFVLSGFLITGILLETKESGGFFRNFYGRRALRILPLFYAVVVVAVLIFPVVYRLAPIHSTALDGYTHDLWSNQLWLWTYMQNFIQAIRPHQLPGLGHLWSLAIEEQFYLAWPLVIFLTPKRRLIPFSLACCGAIFVLRFVLLAQGAKPWSIRSWTFTRADTLMLGAVAAVVVRDIRMRARLSRFLPYVIIGGAAFIAISCVVVGGFATETPFIVTTIFPASALTFAALMVKLCEESGGGFVERVLEARWLRMLGFYSYAIYVFHWPIDQAVLALWRRVGVENALNASGTTLGMSIVQFTSVTALSLIAAMLSWRLWEQPWLKRKNRFAYRGVERPSLA